MGVGKTFQDSIYDTDLESSVDPSSLEGWEKEEGEVVGEMAVEVEAEIEEEDASFDYPGHGGGTHHATEYNAEILSVYLIDSDGKQIGEDIKEKLNEKTLERLREKAESKVDSSDFEHEPDYEPDDY